VEDVLADDPLSLLVRWWLAVMLYLDRRFDRAAEVGRQMIALDSSHFLGHWAVGIALDEAGAKLEAVAAFERAHELSGGIPFTLGFLGFAYGRAGRPKPALALLAAAHEMAKGGYVPPSAFALVQIGLGRWEDALCWMDLAIDVRDPIIMPIRTFPFLDPIRSDPRFRVLLQKMNLA
jgi:tetratricopeptide (TPR) repeat protein